MAQNTAVGDCIIQDYRKMLAAPLTQICKVE